ncbi:hypothetical protein GXM_06104 [Nostoc sphaeroides CCNUC1]|uniref:Uncharacterized protein n=1 Tax=Nostoc sphaeroides CCNUC1 TaxID=2653204 RepID=A0A5P8W7I0_9NOSO|nr:hypothetical protein GXM_06104 [Nostoc sphaeroides CCNUC1]
MSLVISYFTYLYVLLVILFLTPVQTRLIASLLLTPNS